MKHSKNIPIFTLELNGLLKKIYLEDALELHEIFEKYAHFTLELNGLFKNIPKMHWG